MPLAHKAEAWPLPQLTAPYLGRAVVRPEPLMDRSQEFGRGHQCFSKPCMASGVWASVLGWGFSQSISDPQGRCWSQE